MSKIATIMRTALMTDHHVHTLLALGLPARDRHTCRDHHTWPMPGRSRPCTLGARVRAGSPSVEGTAREANLPASCMYSDIHMLAVGCWSKIHAHTYTVACYRPRGPRDGGALLKAAKAFLAPSSDGEWREPVPTCGPHGTHSRWSVAWQFLSASTPERQVWGIAEFADELELSRSTTRRYVITLVALGNMAQVARRKDSLAMG